MKNIVFILFSFLAFDSFAIVAECEFGFRSEKKKGGSSADCRVDRNDLTNSCQYILENDNFMSTDDTRVYFTIEKSSTRGDIYYVAINDCALSEDDTGEDGGCYPSECVPDKKCQSQTREFHIDQNKSCGDYCEQSVAGDHYLSVVRCDDPIPDNGSSCDHTPTENCQGGPNGDGTTGNYPPSTEAGPLGEWDCEYNPFMCDYDTNNDGQINDSDDRNDWPDPSDGVSDGSACISQGSDSCGIIEEHHGDDVNGDGVVGDPNDIGVNSDGSTGSGNSSDSSTGIVDKDVAAENGIDCPTSQKMYCNSQGYESYGWGYAGPACMDGNEVLSPARKCDDTLGQEDVSVDGETIDQTLLRQLEKEAREQNMTLKGLLESMDRQRQQIVESNTSQTSELGKILSEIKQAIIDNSSGGGSGGGDGSEPVELDLTPVVTELQKINESLDAPLVIVEQGEFESLDQVLDDEKAVYQDKITSIRSELSSIFSITNHEQLTLTCSTSWEVFGTVIPFCINEYEQEIKKIGNALVALSLIMSVFIMLGGVRL